MVSKFYLFAPVVKEIIKTYVENGQSLIMEGCYIPFGREKDFADDYQCDIKYIGSSLTIRCKLAHKLHVPFKKGGNYDV